MSQARTAAVLAATALGVSGCVGATTPLAARTRARRRAPELHAPAPRPRRYPRSTRPVPILMYHVIGSPPASAPYPELYVGSSTFRAQVAWLRGHGYRAVTLDRVYDAWHGRAALPRRPVVLSFDDGYPSDVAVALPVLRRYHWPAVLNLQVGNLIPAKVRLLVRGGWEIDAHTFTHPDLTTVSRTQLRREVAGSRTWIRGVFGVPVDFFCYPSGRYDATVIAEVRRAGYLGATTTNYGVARPSDGMYTLSRVRVNRSDGVAGLAAALGRAP